MKNSFIFSTVLSLTSAISLPALTTVTFLQSSVICAQAGVQVKSPAPDFKLVDSNGKEQSLSQFKGKYVVLEWTNPDCPFVKKHYKSGNMPKLQQAAEKKGVVWLTIDSSAEGKEGHIAAKDAKQFKEGQYKNSNFLLLDSDGKVGQTYGAKATPHMFIIDPEGILIYQGAIDSIPSADPKDIAKATNYVQTGLEESMAKKPVTTSSTKAYGCSIKY